MSRPGEQVQRDAQRDAEMLRAGQRSGMVNDLTPEELRGLRVTVPRPGGGTIDVPSFQERRQTTFPAELESLRARNAAERAAGPSFGERANAALAGTARGMGYALPVLGGFGGSMTASPGLGTALGIAGGEALRQTIMGLGDVPTQEDLPESLQPYFIGGEVLGGSVGPGLGPLAMGARRTGIRFIDNIIGGAQRSPNIYMTAEGLSAAGSAAGTGAAAEIGGVDNTLAQLGGGLAGGVAGAPALMPVTSLATQGFNRARAWLSSAGQTNRAATELRRVVETAGEDPVALANALRTVDLPGANRTSAQLTGSPALQALEAELAVRNHQFGREARESAEASLEVIRRTIGALSSTGDPAALREAAQLRQTYFNQLINGRIARAQDEARELIEELGESPAIRAELGRRTATILDEALTNVRQVEREMWSAIPGNTRMNTSRVTAEANRIRTEELLEEETLEPLITSFVNRTQNGVSARELLRFRSLMLEKARELSAAGSPSTARLYGYMAEAALDDLETLPGSEAAREFSRELNDVFTRSFAGQAQQTQRTGAERIPPELLVRRATAGPVEAADLRLRELERAVRMGSPEAADEILDIQQRVMRAAFSEIVDPQTGVVNPRRMNRFIRANRPILDRFPELLEQFQSTATAQEMFDIAQASGKRAQRAITRDAAFARVAGAESPVRAVANALTGAEPQSQFRQLALLAQRQGDAATEGLQSAALQFAYERAGGSTGAFSFSNYRQALMEPLSLGQPPLMDLMRRNGVLDADTAARFTRLLDEADKVEQTIRTASGGIDELLEGENMLADLAVRVIGSRAGTAAAGRNTGPQLIAASAGSRFARRIFEQIPTGRVQELLVEAAQNPQFMAALLERPATLQEKLRLARKANAWLIALGLNQINDPGQEPEQ